MAPYFSLRSLRAWLRDSICIDGEKRKETTAELTAACAFLGRPLTLASVETLHDALMPGYPMQAGGMRQQLEQVLQNTDPYGSHIAFLLLQPFAYGNGRTARLVWAKKMMLKDRKPCDRPFLVLFYEQSLATAEDCLRVMMQAASIAPLDAKLPKGKGRAGGIARARGLSSERRSEIARGAARERWKMRA